MAKYMSMAKKKKTPGSISPKSVVTDKEGTSSATGTSIDLTNIKMVSTVVMTRINIKSLPL